MTSPRRVGELGDRGRHASHVEFRQNMIVTQRPRPALKSARRVDSRVDGERENRRGDRCESRTRADRRETAHRRGVLGHRGVSTVGRCARGGGGAPRARDGDARRTPIWRKGRRRNTTSTRRATRADRAQGTMEEQCEHESRDARRTRARDEDGTPHARGARRAPIVRKGRWRNNAGMRRATYADLTQGTNKEHHKHETRDARRSGARDDGGTPRARGARRAPFVRKGKFSERE